MDSFEWNKIAAAGLIAVLVFTVVRIAADEIFHRPHVPVAGMEEVEAAAEPEQAAPEEPSLAELFASGSTSRGESAFRKCQACHVAAEGAPHRIGPNLWDVVGASIPHTPDFPYSSAMQEHGGTWDYQTLDRFLANPAKEVPGTKMTFAGIRDAQERANVILYLREQGVSPPPLPEPPAAEEPAPEEEAEQAAAAGE